MCLSSWATTSLEDVAKAAPSGLRWFQLYVYKDRAMSAAIVRRAEAAGYKALVLTVDAPLLGRRVRQLVLRPHTRRHVGHVCAASPLTVVHGSPATIAVGCAGARRKTTCATGSAFRRSGSWPTLPTPRIKRRP